MMHASRVGDPSTKTPGAAGDRTRTLSTTAQRYARTSPVPGHGSAAAQGQFEPTHPIPTALKVAAEPHETAAAG